jgi:hypothetical protein
MKKGFFPGTYSLDKHYRGDMDKGLKQIGNRSIASYLTDIKVICASYIVKTPGPESGMSIHQDMSLVDESRFTGINIWIPLIDLTIENGALLFCRRATVFSLLIGGSSITEFFGNVMGDMIDFLHPVLVKAGQAVILIKALFIILHRIIQIKLGLLLIPILHTKTQNLEPIFGNQVWEKTM